MTVNIGALHISLTFDASNFTRGVLDTQHAIADLGKEIGAQLKEIQTKVRNFGVGLTAGISLPFGAMVAIAGKSAGAFEAAMNRIEAALGNARPEQLKALADAAKELGPAVGRTALEAAEGIEALALAGLNAESILGGALKATLTLAAANNSELAPAAALVTDVLAQFAKTSRELPHIVDLVTGALDSSKFSFIDYQQAISQAGGVAGSVGVSFEDFNVAIAATATQFASGSDAGTSFKSFLSSLNPKSKEAAYTMEVLAKRIGETGNLFFTASGDMKSVADIADVLRKSLGGLSEQSRSEALTNLFGADGMRTAIGLLKQGSEGIKRFQDQIAQGSAADKLATQMSGLEAANKRLAASWDALKLALGEAGIVGALTALANGLRGVAQAIADLPPWVLKAGLAFAAFASTIGPMLVILSGMSKFLLPLVAARFGTLGIVISAVISPVTTIIALIGTALVKAVLSATFALLGLSAGWVAAAGPIAIVIVGLGLLIAETYRTAKAEGVYAKALEESEKAKAEAEEAALSLALATGKARKESIENAKQLVREKGALLETAKANLIAAKAALIKAKASAQASTMETTRDRGGWASVGQSLANRKAVGQAEANLRAAIKAGTDMSEAVQKLVRDIKDAEASSAGSENVDFTPPGRDPKGRTAHGKTAAEIEADYKQEMSRLRIEELNARLALTTDVEKRAELQKQILQEEYNGRAAEIMNNKDFNPAQKADQIKALQKLYSSDEMKGPWEGGDWVASGGGLYNRAQAKELEERQRALAEDALSREAETLRAEADLIKSRQGRLAIEREILDLSEKEARSKLEGQIAAGQIADAAKERAQLERRLAASRAGVERDYQSPGQKYVDGLTLSAEQAADAIEEIKLRGLDNLTDGLTAAITGAGSLADAFKNMARSIINDLARIAIQQSIIKPLAESLFGAGSSGIGGGGGGGLFGSIAGALGGLFGGGSGGTAGSFSMGADGFLSMGSAPVLPGMATGGSFRIPGLPGVDMNTLGINGNPIARVSAGEMLTVTPKGGFGGGRHTINMPITINAPGADAAALGRLQGEVRGLKSSLPGMILNTVAEGRKRINHQY